MSGPTHMTISLEIVLLMQWLLKHKQGALRELVATALNNPEFANALFEHAEFGDTQSLSDEAFDELSETIDTFFLFLEDALATIPGHHRAARSKLSAKTHAQLAADFTPEEIELGVYAASEHLRSQRGSTPLIDDASELTRQALLATLLNNWNPYSPEEDDRSDLN